MQVEHPRDQGALEPRRVIVVVGDGKGSWFWPVFCTLLLTVGERILHPHQIQREFVGLVISGHTFGMFALSPLSGRLAGRFGTPRVIAAGLAVSAFASTLAAVAPPDGGTLLFVALFLLGWGWNLGFVAGSALLTEGLDGAERTTLQGATDAMIWSSAAAAALGQARPARANLLRR